MFRLEHIKYFKFDSAIILNSELTNFIHAGNNDRLTSLVNINEVYFDGSKVNGFIIIENFRYILIK